MRPPPRYHGLLAVVLTVLAFSLLYLCAFDGTTPRSRKAGPFAGAFSAFGRGNTANDDRPPPSLGSSASGGAAAGTQSHGEEFNIRTGTLLYLLMGTSYPAHRWLKRCSWTNVSLLYLSWKENVTDTVMNNDTLPGEGRLRVGFLPQSTWTTGRNYLADMARQWETEQGWQFETWVFMDEDVYLRARVPATTPAPAGDAGDDVAFRRLNLVLRRDRPMRAGVMFIHPTADAACRRRCDVDHALLAMHRTGVDLQLPYYAMMDMVSWWYSAAISNHYATAVFPTHCSEYHDVCIVHAQQQHASYPRGTDGRFLLVKRFVGACLAKAGAPGFRRRGMADTKLEAAFAERGAEATPCIASSSPDVNYFATAQQNNWTKYLSCLSH